MFVLATLMSLINQVAGTPYIPGGDSPAGTDCSGLASWVANAATDRPVFGNRFNTGNGHTAVTLPDGTPVSSGERGGVHIGGAGAYQPGFTHHMFLPMPPDGDGAAVLPPDAPPPPPDAPPPAPVLVDTVAPAPAPLPAPDGPPPGNPGIANP
jgi:hypothetical protein